MAYALIASASGVTGDTMVATVGPFDATGADLITVVVSWYTGNSNAMSVTDGSNTYVPRTLKEQGTVAAQIWDVAAPSVGGAMSVVVSATNPTLPIYASVMVLAWSGSDATPFDGESAGGGAGSTNVIQPGSLTPTQAGDLILTGVVFEDNSAGAVSINGGFTISDTEAYGGGVNEGGSAAYLIQGAAAAANPTWDVSNAPSVIASVMAAYKAGAGAGPRRFFLV